VAELQGRVERHLAQGGSLEDLPVIDPASLPVKPGIPKGSAGGVDQLERDMGSAPQHIQAAVSSGVEARRLREGGSQASGATASVNVELPTAVEAELMRAPIAEELEGVNPDLIRKHRLLDRQKGREQQHAATLLQATKVSRLPVAVSFLRPHFFAKKKRVLPLRDVVSAMTSNPRLQSPSVGQAEQMLQLVVSQLGDWCQFRDGKGQVAEAVAGAKFVWLKYDADYKEVLKRATAIGDAPAPGPGPGGAPSAIR